MQLIPRVLRIQTDVLVLTAMVQALARWSGGQRFLIDLARHGREPLFDDVDVSRTAGWFTTITPALLGTDTDDPERTLASIEEQLSFPDQGFGYGLLRYLGDDEQVTARLRSLPRAGVLFNYIGQWFDIDRSAAAVFRPIRMLDGSANDLQSDRGYLLIVSGGVERNRLRLFWQYSENVHRKETVERLTGAFAESLRALISHCTSRGTAGVANGQ
jgi:non-ribosomal peptide synthase protein (TIGR01720 family)